MAICTSSTTETPPSIASRLSESAFSGACQNSVAVASLHTFAAQYEDRHAIIYGRFRIKRITEVVEKFVLCGDFSQGVARIRCTNPDCKYEYFRPFSCKGFYFCPSCSQKRTLLFSEYMNDRLLLALPHRQFVFTSPSY